MLLPGVTCITVLVRSTCNTLQHSTVTLIYFHLTYCYKPLIPHILSVLPPTGGQRGRRWRDGWILCFIVLQLVYVELFVFVILLHYMLMVCCLLRVCKLHFVHLTIKKCHIARVSHWIVLRCISVINKKLILIRIKSNATFDSLSVTVLDTFAI